MGDLLVALVFFALGVLCSAVYLFVLGFAHGKVATTVWDVLSSLIGLALVWWTNFSVNNGQFRLFVALSFLFGVVINAIISKRTLDKLSKAMYNLFTKKGVDKDGKSIL